ncbi:MAG: hypothetical protein JNL70_06135 [Saprospiraceae bacterium]|nr:hypothetical protein [Saprospiraceae bacterium]
MKKALISWKHIPLSIFLLVGTFSQAQTYCTAKATAPWEAWLGRVHVSNALGSTSFPATQKEGYGNFTNLAPAPMLRNNGNLVTIEPQASWMGDPRHASLFWRVWIDFNKDGDFADADEQVINRQVVYQNQLFFDNENAFTVPATAALGNTRMRIAMKYNAYPTACETFDRGEVEDYTVQITEGGQTAAPDLVLENISAASVFEVGVGHNLGYYIRNASNVATASAIFSYVYLSSDNQYSSDDILVSSDYTASLATNESVLKNHQIEIPPTWTHTNPYFIIRVAPLSNETNTANNNGSIAINVTLPTIPTCSNSLGNTQLLCYSPNTDGSTTLIVSDGNNLIQKQVDKNGQPISSSTLGTAQKDSILVRNNQVIKKLVNGTLAYTKNIAPSVLSRLPKIDAALEMGDGTFVLAGFQKFYDPTYPPNNRDSLVLVTTDAQLNYLDHTVEARNQGPYNVPFDTCYQLFLLPNNQFLLSYGYGVVGLLTVSNHNLVKYQKTNNNLQRLKASNLGIGAPQTPMIVAACGNHLIFSINGSRYGQKGSFSGTLTTLFNTDSLIPLTLREVGQGSTDYYGQYRTYSYYYRPSLRDTAYRLSANFAGDPRVGYNNFTRLEVRFLDNALTVPTHVKNILFVPYDHIVRTGDTTCLVLGSRNGILWAWNPDCGNTPMPQPDLTLATLTLPTPSVQRGQILNWKVDIKNIGTANAPGNFAVKAYVSTDSVLSADDVQDGIIPTGNFNSGFSVSQVNGASTLPATLAIGRYYLILKVDADNQVVESNENNNILVSATQFSVISNESSADMAMSMTVNPSVFTKFSPLNVIITAKNTGNQAFTNVIVEFKFPIGTTNGGAAVASVGIWREWCAGSVQCFQWAIPNLAVDATATLQVPLYVLNPTSPIMATAKLLSSTPTDANLSNNIATLSINSAAPLQASIRQKPTQLVPVVIQSIHPTVTEGEVVVELESLIDQTVQFGFYNINGKELQSATRVLQKGSNHLNFDLFDLPQGIYFIQTDAGKGLNVPTKFLKF